jgi:hypothetical protein
VVLDLGLHGPFEEAAERFSVHLSLPETETRERVSQTRPLT